MGQLNVRIPDDLEEKLRYIAARKFGFRKGALKRAVIEALREWVENNSHILVEGGRESVKGRYEGDNI